VGLSAWVRARAIHGGHIAGVCAGVYGGLFCSELGFVAQEDFSEDLMIYVRPEL
jgi:ABC-type branched-subunit amino acid transport system permease subunit